MAAISADLPGLGGLARAARGAQRLALRPGEPPRPGRQVGALSLERVWGDLPPEFVVYSVPRCAGAVPIFLGGVLFRMPFWLLAAEPDAIGGASSCLCEEGPRQPAETATRDSPDARNGTQCLTKFRPGRSAS